MTDIYSDLDRLIQKYGLHEVYEIVKVRHDQRNRDVQAFIQESIDEATQ